MAQDRLESLRFAAWVAGQSWPSDSHRLEPRDQVIDVAVPIALERILARVVFEAVELDDHPFGLEQRIDDPAGDGGVDLWGRESVAVRERDERVLELRPCRSVRRSLYERREPRRTRMTTASIEQLREGIETQEARDTKIVDRSGQRALVQTRRDVEQRSRGAGDPGHRGACGCPRPSRDEAAAAE